MTALPSPPRPDPDPSPPSARPLHIHALLADGSLRVEWSDPLAASVERWLPLVPSVPGYSDAATIRVVQGPLAEEADEDEPPTLQLGGVAARVTGDAVRLRGHRGLAGGRIDLAARTAEIRCPDPASLPPVAGDEVFSSLTLASALLLGRLRRAMVHAAAVVAPDGRAWLLVGDSHSGKTTTTVNLIGAGWGWLSDDTSVLATDAHGGVTVEGWPRRFHLDAGWERGAPGLPRGEVDPRDRWTAAWRRQAPLAGLLFPRVQAGRPTQLSPSGGSDALAALIRQSPWLLADRASAAGLLALLQAAAARPAFALALGLDTFRGGPPLLAALHSLPTTATPAR